MIDLVFSSSSLSKFGGPVHFLAQRWRAKVIPRFFTEKSCLKLHPNQLESLWRNHWTIENPLHYVRNETLGEDRGQAWKGHTAQTLAALRNGLLTGLQHQGWTSIAQALRYHASSIQRSLQTEVSVSPTTGALQVDPQSTTAKLQVLPTFSRP